MARMTPVVSRKAPDVAKKARALHKRLRAVKELKEKQASGTTLNQGEMLKVAGEQKILADLEAIGLGL